MAGETAGDKLLLRGARVIDPIRDLDAFRDVLIEDGHIAAVDASIDTSDCDVVELAGKVLTPGLIDGRAHLGEPGYEHRETLRSGLRAATAGGFTAVLVLPDTAPPNDSRAVCEMLVRAGGPRSRTCSRARLYPMAALSKGLRGEELAELSELAEAGAVAATDAEKPVPGGLMRRALLYARHAGLPVVHRPRDPDLDGDGVMHEGRWSTRLGLPGCPGLSEETVLARDLLLVADTGGRYHASSITTAGGLEQIRRAKDAGLDVTCDTTIHHLLLTDQAVLDSGFSVAMRFQPPLRSEADRQALHAALVDGTIDAIVSDHRPWHSDEKLDVQFSVTPAGAVGLETAVPVTLDRLVHQGVIDLARWVDLLSAGPARVFDLDAGSLAVGAVADLTVLDLDLETTLDAASFRSLSRSTPFDGWNVRGAAVSTYLDGRRVERG